MSGPTQGERPSRAKWCIGVLGVLAISCGANPTSDPSTPPDRVVSSTSSPGAPGTSAPDRVDPVRIDGVRARLDGMSIVVAFVGAKEPTVSPDACAAEYELDVEERADMVRLSVWRKPTTSSAITVACPAIGYSRTVSASLAAPIGDRAVVAADSTFEPVPTSLLLVPTPMPDGWQLLQESGNSASTPDGTPTRQQWSQTFGPQEGAGLQVTMSWGLPCDETTFGPGATPTTVRGVDGLLLPQALAGPALQWREGEACVRLMDLSARPPTELIAAAEQLAPSTRTD